MKDYKNSDLYKEYRSVHKDNQIQFLKKNNKVFFETDHWLCIYNKYHKKRLTVFHKGAGVYREDITDPEEIADLNIAMIDLNLHTKKQWVNAWKDRSIERFHFHIQIHD
jgi:hypothetical protein